MSKITIPDNSILLLEGGSLRGLFTAGVLDTFMENDVYFPAVAGVSAGSLNALNYASHQPGRSASLAARPASTCATATTAGTSAPRRRCAAAVCLA